MSRVLIYVPAEAIDAKRPVRKKVFFPIEAAYLASLLKFDGHSVHVLDGNLHNDPLCKARELAQTCSPDFVVSAPQMLTFHIAENIELTLSVLGTFSNSTRIAAGHYVTSNPASLLSRQEVDYLVVHDFELSMSRLITALSNNEIEQVNSLPGVIKCGEAKNEVIPPPKVHFDELPRADYELFKYEQYFNFPEKGNIRYPEKSRRFIQYQSSRGCPFHCSFCNVSYLRGSRTHQRHGIDRIIDDLDYLVNELGIEEIHFFDENILTNRKHTSQLFHEIMRRNIRFHWVPATGISIYLLNDELIDLLNESGCYRLNLAFESGSQHTLDRIIKKPVQLHRDLETLKKCRDKGYENIGYFIIGFPDEDSTMMKETFEVASNPDFDYVVFSIATPQSGTELGTQAMKLLDKKQNIDLLAKRSEAAYQTRYFNQRELEKLRVEKWDSINFATEQKRMTICRMMGISPDELEEIRSKSLELFTTRWSQGKDAQPHG